MKTKFCRCGHKYEDHNIYDRDGDFFCDLCKCDMFHERETEE